jgi:hypothetical protein
MRSSSLAAAAGVALAVAALGAVPATAVTPERAPSTPMCATSQLTASLGGGDAGAGHLYRYLVLTNHSRTSCHLTGFPGLSLLDAGGRRIGAPATREHPSYAPVVIRPGGSASDTVHTLNHQGSCLPTSARLRVYPPGNRASLVFPGEVTVCGGRFGVTPFAAGTAGNPSGGASSTPSPTPSATPVPSATPAPPSGRQVPVVPSGAPDTGLGAVASANPGDSDGLGGPTVAAGAGGALVLAGLGFAVRRRRTSSARVQG